MKSLMLRSIIILNTALSVIACDKPKTGPRNVHEPKKDWVVLRTPEDQSVEEKEFHSVDLTYMQEAFKNNKDLINNIILPLSRFVLNSKFIEAPKYQNQRMAEMIGLFNRAMISLLQSKNSDQRLQNMKQKFEATVFSGCSRDLKSDCLNVDMFSSDPHSAQLLLQIVIELDVRLAVLERSYPISEQCVQQSDDCRDMVEGRYRLLVMALRLDRNRLVNEDLSFAYMRHARLFAHLMDWWKNHPEQTNSSLSMSYINETHGKIFDVMINAYQPKDINDPEFRKFVSNFNPWLYSNHDNNIFRNGARVMFELAAKCCLYEDAAKTKLSEEVVEATKAMQEQRDEFNFSFLKAVQAAQSSDGKSVLDRMGMSTVSATLLNIESDFYDEYFYIVDRLFRQHIDTAEALMLMRNVNPKRAEERFAKVIETYARVVLLDMIRQTNEYMAGIYNSPDIGSDQVFQQAVLSSRTITEKWHGVQKNLDFLNKFAGSYFKALNKRNLSYEQLDKIIQAVNRNIHFVSVYPNMIVMNYYLTKMKGKVVVPTWWGTPLEISADTILDDFFGGFLKSTWFRFGVAEEPLDREKILYAFYYALSTQTLETFVAKDESTKTQETDRSKFINVILPKYLEDVDRDLTKNLESYRVSYENNANYSLVKKVCDYEMGVSQISPRLEMNLSDLDYYTYTGARDVGIVNVLSTLLNGPSSIFDHVRGPMNDKITYVEAMLSMIENDLLARRKIDKQGDSHPDLDKTRNMIRSMQVKVKQFVSQYNSQREKVFDCLMRLQTVERGRQNVLYDEERKHLAWVYDTMAELKDITNSAQLNERVNKINADKFKEFRFDRLEGKSYRMSKYDLYLRMKKRIEGNLDNLMPSELKKSRQVVVLIASGVERSDMVEREINVSVPWNDNKEEFIRQGMLALSSSSPSSFIHWRSQIAQDFSVENYLSTLIKMYFAVDESKITSLDLLDVFLVSLKRVMMDETEFKNAVDFGIDGLRDYAYFENLLIEKNSQNSLPLLYKLFNDIYSQAKVDVKVTFATDSRVEYNSALNMANTLNNMLTLIFEPDSSLKENLVKLYGERINNHLNKTRTLLGELNNESTKALVGQAMAPYFAYPILTNSGQPIYWGKIGSTAFADEQTVQNLKVREDQFIRDTGDIYKTREALHGVQ